MAGTKSKENPPLSPIPWPIVPQLFYSLTVKEWLTVRKLVFVHQICRCRRVWNVDVVCIYCLRSSGTTEEEILLFSLLTQICSESEKYLWFNFNI